MKLVRKTLFWLHLISGVLAGIVIFVMCVTGALLAFQANILEFAESDMRVVVPPTESAARLPTSEIVAKTIAAKPNLKPSSITLQNDKTAAAVISAGRGSQIFVNPYTGAITGEGAGNWRGFFRFVEDLHRWLAVPGDARPIGEAVNDASNFIFLFLALSGIYIWFPRRLTAKHFKAALTPRWKVTGKARNFNWHTVIGFWSSLVLIILTLTAVVMSYNWANNLVYTLTNSEVPPPPPQQGQPNQANQTGDQPFVLPENINDLWAKAENQTAWKSISVRLPFAKDAAVFTIDENKYANKFGRSTLTLNAKTGEISKWESYGEQSSGRQLRSWIRYTHTGESFGIIGQIIGFLACIGGAVLVYTGLALSWRRFGDWRSRKSKS